MTPADDRELPHNLLGDLLIEADQAERVGDLSAAAARLRAHLAVHARDDVTRLRLGSLLITLGERDAARQVIEPVDVVEDPVRRGQANRLLAALDESAGALTSAAIRWERTLADDIDDPEARGHLAALRPENIQWPSSNLPFATLVSPEGLRTSRFRLVRELGRGATATVYLVHDERLALPLALKVLHPQLAAAARAGARERFFAEARLAARLRHPGVVAIYDVDETTRCLAMELIAGGTMRDRLRTGSKSDVPGTAAPTADIPADEALATARSLLEALAYVHRAGIVHGDLKPGNVLLRKPAEVVLADFGIAQLTSAMDPGADRPVGTPLYLAPEQFRGASASRRTDLFAAGAILWELLSGRPARRQSSLLTGKLDPPPAIPPEVLAPLGQAGTRLAAMIAALLATDPNARPPTAEAALDTLAP